MIDKRSLFRDVESVLLSFEFGHLSADEAIAACALEIKKALDADAASIDAQYAANNDSMLHKVPR